MLGGFFKQQLKTQSAIPYSQRLAKRGDIRYGFVRFGQGMDPEKDNRSWQEKFSNTKGAGLWAMGINPDDPQAEQKARAMLGRILNNPKYQTGVWGSTEWGRDDAKMPGVRQLLAANPNIKATELLDYAKRAPQAQNALQPRDIGEGILDAVAMAGLTLMSGGNPTLAMMYGAARRGEQSDSIWGAAGGALEGYSIASGVSGLSEGITAAGGINSYVSSIPNNIRGFLQYGPELTNVNSFYGSATSGAAAGASSAMRAAGSSGFLNNVFGTGSSGASAVQGAAGGGGQMAGNWFTDILREAAPSLLNTGVQAGINYFTSQNNQDAFNQAAQQAATMSQFNPYSISGPMGGVAFDGTNAVASLSPAMQKQLAEANKVAGGYLTAANKFNPSNYAQNYYNTIKEMNFPQENATTNDLLNRVYATGNWGSTVGAQDISSVARQQQIADQVLRIQAQQAGAQEQDRLFTNYFNAAKTAQGIMASPYDLATMGGNLGAQGAQAGANAARYPWLAANSSINASTAFWDTISSSAGRLAENAFNKYASYSSNPSRATAAEASPYFSGGNTSMRWSGGNGLFG